MEIKKVEYFEVDYSEVDRFVNEYYNMPKNKYGAYEWEIAADLESPNDVSHTFDIDGILDKYDEKRLSNFLKGDIEGFIARVLMNDLARKGLIPKGEYLIKVSW